MAPKRKVEKPKPDEHDELYKQEPKKKKDTSYLYDGGSRSIPSGCRACGGPYPMCKSSCSAYDD